GPSEIGKLVERGSHGTAGIEDVIDDHDVAAIDSPGNVCCADYRARTDCLEIVAIERDVERAEEDFRVLALFDEAANCARELNTAALDSNDNEIFGPF